MNTEATPGALGSTEVLGPWGWHARDGGAAYPAATVDTWPAHNKKRFIEPVYSHAALMTAVHLAVAAERERIRAALLEMHARTDAHNYYKCAAVELFGA